jgi:hypothetical protein
LFIRALPRVLLPRPAPRGFVVQNEEDRGS